MEHIAFDHTPMGEAEVARRQRRIGNKRGLCSYLIISAITLLGVMYYIPAFDAPSLDQMSASAHAWFIACAAYIAVAGGGAFLRLVFWWSWDDAELRGLEALSYQELGKLKELCEASDLAKVVVAGWLANGANLRARDLGAIRGLVASVKAGDQVREGEALRKKILQTLGEPAVDRAVLTPMGSEPHHKVSAAPFPTANGGRTSVPDDEAKTQVVGSQARPARSLLDLLNDSERIAMTHWADTQEGERPDLITWPGWTEVLARRHWEGASA